MNCHLSFVKSILLTFSLLIASPLFSKNNTTKKPEKNHMRSYVLWMQAQYLQKNHQKNKALKTISEALIYNPSSIEFLSQKLQLQWTLKKKKQAFKTLDKLIKNKKRELYLTRRKTQYSNRLQINNIAKKDKINKKEVLSDKNMRVFKEEIKQLEKQQNRPLKDEFLYTKKLLILKHWQAARIQLQRLVKLYPRAAIYNYAAYQNIRYPLLNLETSEDWAEEALFSSPLNAAYLDTYASILVQNKELQRAEKYLLFAAQLAEFDLEIKSHLTLLREQIRKGHFKIK